MLANGVTKCRNYGRYLGNRYKSFDNIVWLSGNDFQTWSNAANDTVATAVALGIKDNDSRHIHTIELNYLVSGSLDDPNWAPIVSLNASYTYYPTYAQVLKDYNRTDFQPVFSHRGQLRIRKPAGAGDDRGHPAAAGILDKT